MNITYINTGDVIGNKTDYTAPFFIPIAAGLKQELLFEGMGSVTNMQIAVYRNGSMVINQQIIPSATMKIDLSLFAQALPSLNENYKNLKGHPTSNVQDHVLFRFLDGATIRTYRFYVCLVNCPYLNSRGRVHTDELNLVYPSGASTVSPNLVSVPVSGGAVKEAITHPTRGVGTKLSGGTNWIANLPQTTRVIGAGVMITMSIYVENTGAGKFHLHALYSVDPVTGGNLSKSTTINPGFKGTVSVTVKTVSANNRPYFFVTADTGESFEANFHCQMMNFGSEAKPWIRSEADINSPCVGAMTDYRSGKCMDTTQIIPFTLYGAVLPPAGVNRDGRLYYPVGPDATPKTLSGSTDAGWEIYSGYAMIDGINRRVINTDGSVYGWIEVENKLPKDVSPDCGVWLRWLNSKGWYDSMFFEKYSIKPIILANNTGGNSIDYYEVTVQTDINWDNEPCLGWIQRSSDIVARLPKDICQLATATLLSTNVFQSVGGGKTKSIQFKFKVKIVEP